MAHHSLLQQKRNARSTTTVSANRTSIQSLARLRQQRTTPVSSQQSESTSHTSPLLRRVLHALSVIPFFAVLAFGLFGPLFKVQTISCQTTTQTACHEAVVAEFQSQKGQHILWINFSGTIEKVKKAYPLYQSFTITRQFPNTILVTIEPSPIAYTIEMDGEKLNVNEAGIATIWQENTQQTPLITLEDEASTRVQEQEPLPSDLHDHLLTLHQQLQFFSPNIENVIVHSTQEIEIHTSEKTLLVSMSNLSNQLTIGQKILQYPLEEEWTTADLRFNKPVLTRDQ